MASKGSGHSGRSGKGSHGAVAPITPAQKETNDIRKALGLPEGEQSHSAEVMEARENLSQAGIGDFESIKEATRELEAWTPGQSAQTKRDVTIYKLRSGAEIVIPSNVDKAKQKIYAQQIAQHIESLEPELRATIKQVILLDYRNPADSYWEKTYNMKGFKSYATGGQGVISFYENQYANNSSKTIFGTIAHEAGHNMQKAIGQAVFDREYQKAIDKDTAAGKSRYVSTYAKQSKAIHEDASDAYKAYHLDKKAFKKDFPNRYKFIHATLNHKA